MVPEVEVEAGASAVAWPLVRRRLPVAGSVVSACLRLLADASVASTAATFASRRSSLGRTCDGEARRRVVEVGRELQLPQR